MLRGQALKWFPSMDNVSPIYTEPVNWHQPAVSNGGIIAHCFLLTVLALQARKKRKKKNTKKWVFSTPHCNSLQIDIHYICCVNDIRSLAACVHAPCVYFGLCVIQRQWCGWLMKRMSKRIQLNSFLRVRLVFSPTTIIEGWVILCIEVCLAKNHLCEFKQSVISSK